jgi:hypothetical protein
VSHDLTAVASLLVPLSVGGQPLIANIQDLKELKEGEEVDIGVPPPTWNIEEKDQQDNLQGVNRELGNPPDSSSPEGRFKIEGASRGPI